MRERRSGRVLNARQNRLPRFGVSRRVSNDCTRLCCSARAFGENALGRLARDNVLSRGKNESALRNEKKKGSMRRILHNEHLKKKKNDKPRMEKSATLPADCVSILPRAVSSARIFCPLEHITIIIASSSWSRSLETSTRQ